MVWNRGAKKFFLKKVFLEKKRLNGMGHQWNKKNRVIFLKKTTNSKDTDLKCYITKLQI